MDENEAVYENDNETDSNSDATPKQQKRAEVVRSAIDTLNNDRGWLNIKVLGQGTYGDVHLMYDPERDSDIAVKIVTSENLADAELVLWKKLNHPNIIPLLELIPLHKLDAVAFIMPVQHKTLHDVLYDRYFIKNNDALGELKIWLHDILSGLDYLNSRDLCHLDIKVDNVLISDRSTAMLCDFSFLNVTTKPLERYDLGLPYIYRPPEACHSLGSTIAIEGKSYDMWGFGIMLVEIFSHFALATTIPDCRHWLKEVYPTLFYALEERKFAKVMLQTFPSLAVRSLSVKRMQTKLALNFIHGFLMTDYRQRITPSEAMQHKFLNMGTKLGHEPDLVWMIKIPEESEYWDFTFNENIAHSHATYDLTEEQQEIKLAMDAENEFIYDEESMGNTYSPIPYQSDDEDNSDMNCVSQDNDQSTNVASENNVEYFEENGSMHQVFSDENNTQNESLPSLKNSKIRVKELSKHRDSLKLYKSKWLKSGAINTKQGATTKRDKNLAKMVAHSEKIRSKVSKIKPQLSDGENSGSRKVTCFGRSTSYFRIKKMPPPKEDLKNKKVKVLNQMLKSKSKEEEINSDISSSAGTSSSGQFSIESSPSGESDFQKSPHGSSGSETEIFFSRDTSSGSNTGTSRETGLDDESASPNIDCKIGLEGDSKWATGDSLIDQASNSQEDKELPSTSRGVTVLCLETTNQDEIASVAISHHQIHHLRRKLNKLDQMFEELERAFVCENCSSDGKTRSEDRTKWIETVEQECKTDEWDESEINVPDSEVTFIEGDATNVTLDGLSEFPNYETQPGTSEYIRRNAYDMLDSINEQRMNQTASCPVLPRIIVDFDPTSSAENVTESCIVSNRAGKRRANIAQWFRRKYAGMERFFKRFPYKIMK